MDTKSRSIKSGAYFCLWVIIVIGGWFLWFYGVDRVAISLGSYILPFTFGLGVGILSGLSPRRAFLACFFGFFALAVLFAFYNPIEIVWFTIFGVLSGLFAMAGAILRRIFFHRKIEELYMKRWQWILLVGGASVMADYTVILCMYRQLFVYRYVFAFIQLFIPVLICLFALGLYTGLFSRLEHEELSKFVITASISGHICFLFYMLFLCIVRHRTWESFVMIPLIGVYFLVLYKGAQIGFRLRNREFIRKLQ
jgi:hypothetical protein